MKGQYDYKFQNFDTEEKKAPCSRIDSTSLQMKTSLDSTKPFTETSQSKFQIDYLEKVKTMENLISVIKQNAYDKYKKELEDKLLLKNELETNVGILSEYIKMNRMQNRNFGTLSKSIVKENERLYSSSQRASEQQFYLTKELPGMRSEINKMQNDISLYNEDTKELKNKKLLIERDMMYLQNEIKFMFSPREDR